MHIRWNSTYYMLRKCGGYNQVISFYYNSKINKTLLGEDEWNVCFTLLDYFKVFYHATCNNSGVYYPPSPIALHDLYVISDTFAKYKSKQIVISQ